MKNKWYGLLVFLIPLFVFLHNLKAGFVWDDYVVLTELKDVVNPFNINSLPWLSGRFFRPIATVSLQIDTLLWGNNPLGFHLTSLLIHCINGLLLFILFSELLGEKTAFFGALLFSLHPVNSEVVSWISCRFDLLALFFGLLSLLSLYQYISTERKIALLATFVFGLFSMLSKETGIMLFVLLPAFYYFFKKDSSRWGLSLTLTMFVLAIVIAVFSFGERILLVNKSLFQTASLGLKIIALFIYKIFNWKYISPYSACLVDRIGNQSLLLSVALIIVTTALVFVGYKRKSPFSFFALWIVLTIVPGLYVSLSKNYRLPGSDRFLYSVMPAVVFIAVFWGIKYFKKISMAVFIILIPITAYGSYSQSAKWHDNYSLWKSTSLQCNNQWSYPLLSYGLSALEKKPQEAEMLFERLIKETDRGKLKTLYPVESTLYRLNAIVRLGILYDRKKNYRQSDRLFKRALREYKKLITAYPNITKWELGGINYLIGYHYYLKAARDQNIDYIKVALKQVDYAIKYRPGDIKPYLLKTEILLGIKDCKNAFQVLSILYERFGKTQELINSISRFKKICKPQSKKLPSG